MGQWLRDYCHVGLTIMCVDRSGRCADVCWDVRSLMSLRVHEAALVTRDRRSMERLRHCTGAQSSCNLGEGATPQRANETS